MENKPLSRLDISDADILANRQKIIAYLKTPGLHKTTGFLRYQTGRCCLGHMCDALGLSPVKSGSNWTYDDEAYILPLTIRVQLGMYNESGGFRSEGDIAWITYKGGQYNCLANLNDDTKIRPKEIAEMLEKMIEGGDGTPWRKLIL